MLNDENKEYGMTVHMATVFAKDGTVSVGFSMDDSEGLEIDIKHDADSIEEAYDYILKECEAIAEEHVNKKLEEDRKAKYDKDGNDAYVEELLDEIRSLKIDNQILKKRCDDIADKYDNVLKSQAEDLKNRISKEDATAALKRECDKLRFENGCRVDRVLDMFKPWSHL